MLPTFTSDVSWRSSSGTRSIPRCSISKISATLAFHVMASGAAGVGSAGTSPSSLAYGSCGLLSPSMVVAGVESLVFDLIGTAPQWQNAAAREGQTWNEVGGPGGHRGGGPGGGGGGLHRQPAAAPPPPTGGNREGEPRKGERAGWARRRDRPAPSTVSPIDTPGGSAY